MDSQSPWDAVEQQVTEIGTLARLASRYRHARETGGAAALQDGLVLAAEARRLYRMAPLDVGAVDLLAARCRHLAERLRDLVNAARTTPTYREAAEAWSAGDAATLARLVPAVFTDLVKATPLRPLYRGIALTVRGNRLRSASEIAQELAQLRTTGIPADEEADGPGVDETLRAVALVDDWTRLEVPFAIRIEAAGASLPIFRVADSGELLVHTRCFGEGRRDVVLERSPPPDRWPDLGTDHADYLSELRAAMQRGGCPYVLIDVC